MSDVIWTVCEVCEKIIYETPCPHCIESTETVDRLKEKLFTYEDMLACFAAGMNYSTGRNNETFDERMKRLYDWKTIT